LVIRCLAFAAFVQGFENVGTVAFRKELDFRKEFKLVAAKKIAMFAVTVPMAFVLRSYWALVAGIVVGRVASVAITYWVQDYRPRFSLAARAELFQFGQWLVLASFAHFVTTRCADFIVGKFSGPRELGLFNLSYEIASLPTTDLVAPINRAIFPGYARKASNPMELKRSYLDISALIGLLALPIGVGIAAVADLFVVAMLGAQWVGAVPVVVVLSLFGVLVALKSNNHYVYIALGKPKLATMLAFAQMILLLPLLTWGSMRSGAAGAAMGYLAAQALFTPISVLVLRSALDLHLRELLIVFYRPLLSVVAMYMIVRLVATSVHPQADDVVSLLGPLLLCVFVGAAVYVGSSYVLWSIAGKPRGAETLTLQFVATKIWPQLRRTAAALSGGRL
jgi:O-antigen/teichoic acid export membrane protein